MTHNKINRNKPTLRHNKPRQIHTRVRQRKKSSTTTTPHNKKHYNFKQNNTIPSSIPNQLKLKPQLQLTCSFAGKAQVNSFFNRDGPVQNMEQQRQDEEKMLEYQRATKSVVHPVHGAPGFDMAYLEAHQAYMKARADAIYQKYYSTKVVQNNTPLADRSSIWGSPKPLDETIFSFEANVGFGKLAKSPVVNTLPDVRKQKMREIVKELNEIKQHEIKNGIHLGFPQTILDEINPDGSLKRPDVNLTRIYLDHISHENTLFTTANAAKAEIPPLFANNTLPGLKNLPRNSTTPQQQQQSPSSTSQYEQHQQQLQSKPTKIPQNFLQQANSTMTSTYQTQRQPQSAQQSQQQQHQQYHQNTYHRQQQQTVQSSPYRTSPAVKAQIDTIYNDINFQHAGRRF